MLFNFKFIEIYFIDVIYIVKLEGMFYVCVVVYNRVLELLKLVCFDGVIVMLNVLKVKEVVIFGVFVKGGLIIDIMKFLFWVLD